MAIYRATIVDKLTGRELPKEIRANSPEEAEQTLRDGGFIFSAVEYAREDGNPSTIELPRPPKLRREHDGRCFQRYYAPEALRAIWYCACGLIGLVAIGMAISLIVSVVKGRAEWYNLFGLILMPIVAAILAIPIRLGLECIGVLFDILAELRAGGNRNAE